MDFSSAEKDSSMKPKHACLTTIGAGLLPKTVPEMTYDVFSGMLNPTHSLTHSLTSPILVNFGLCGVTPAALLPG